MGIFSRPTLSDLPATRTVFQAGDRILAKVSCTLTEDQYLKIVRAVKKHTQQTDVRVLIINCSLMALVWHQRSLGLISSLASADDIQLKSIDCGVANLDCGVPKFAPGDRLDLVVCRKGLSDIERTSLYYWLKDWAGADVEVYVTEK